jgi:hypothetical protein
MHDKLNAMRQFKTEAEVIAALVEGITYYRTFTYHNVPQLKVVERRVIRKPAPQLDGEPTWWNVRFADTSDKEDIDIVEYIGDMQNVTGKGVFTDVNMAHDYAKACVEAYEKGELGTNKDIWFI